MSHIIYGKFVTGESVADLFSEASNFLKGLVDEVRSFAQEYSHECATHRTENLNEETGLSQSDHLGEGQVRSGYTDKSAQSSFNGLLIESIPQPVSEKMKAVAPNQDTEASIGESAADLFQSASELTKDVAVGIRETWKSFTHGVADEVQSMREDRKTHKKQYKDNLRKVLESQIQSLMAQIKNLENAGTTKKNPTSETGLRDTLEKLKKVIRDSTRDQELRTIRQKLTELEKEIGQRIQEGAKNYEWIVQQAMASFEEMGYTVKIDGHSQGDIFLLGDKEGRKAVVKMDKQMGVVADFSKGYENTPSGQCVEDAAGLLAKLQTRGIHVLIDADKTRPVKPGKRGSHARQKSSQKKAKRKNAAAR